MTCDPSHLFYLRRTSQQQRLLQRAQGSAVAGCFLAFLAFLAFLPVLCHDNARRMQNVTVLAQTLQQLDPNMKRDRTNSGQACAGGLQNFGGGES